MPFHFTFLLLFLHIKKSVNDAVHLQAAVFHIQIGHIQVLSLNFQLAQFCLQHDFFFVKYIYIMMRLSGVHNVDIFDEEKIVLQTELGKLEIQGQHLNLDPESGCGATRQSGRWTAIIDGFFYVEEKKKKSKMKRHSNGRIIPTVIMSQTIIEQQMTQMLQMVLFGWAVMLAADEKRRWQCAAIGPTGKKLREIFSFVCCALCCFGCIWCM